MGREGRAAQCVLFSVNISNQATNTPAINISVGQPLLAGHVEDIALVAGAVDRLALRNQRKLQEDHRTVSK